LILFIFFQFGAMRIPSRVAHRSPDKKATDKVASLFGVSIERRALHRRRAAAAPRAN